MERRIRKDTSLVKANTRIDGRNQSYRELCTKEKADERIVNPFKSNSEVENWYGEGSLQADAYSGLAISLKLNPVSLCIIHDMAGCPL